MARTRKPFGGPEGRPQVAVIGAGPAGLSAARFAQDRGLAVTVFEKESRIGGKSYSVLNGDALNELGTCYTTRAHRQVKHWMREEGVTLRRLGKAVYDGVPIREFVKHGPGGPMAGQAVKFVRAAGRLRRNLLTRPDDPDVRREAALTTQEWVSGLKLGKIERAMVRIQTAQGYGYLQETAAGQTARWCDFDFLLSGVLNELHMPVEGWSGFWERFAKRLNVVTDAQISEVARREGRPALTVNGETQEFDAVISSAPMDEFIRLTDPTEDDRFIAESIDWQAYTTTLLSSSDWFDKYQVMGFSDAARGPDRLGAMLGARLEGESADLGGRLYITGQFSRGLSHEELRDIMREEAVRHDFSIAAIIDQRTWKYFPQYRRDAVAEGLFGRLLSCQGQGGVWFIGSTFSHELVSSVVEHARGVVDQVELSLRNAR
ncbi:MAG: FAD-dependent oxidoreductase [Hyphomonas sp.]|uniref:FAD-dependent oxidoreductase n=1 Tax=Hyphomonas sp. TaxID=87 RepID=UPI003529CA69